MTEQVERQYVIDALSAQESWRMFRIISEFVDAIDAMSGVPKGVSIFGSARVAPAPEEYQLAEDMGGRLAQAGFSVITGGGGGVMEAGNKGATENGGALGGAEHRAAL